MNLLNFLQEQRTDYLKSIEITFARLTQKNEFELFLDVLKSKEDDFTSVKDNFMSIKRHDILVKNIDDKYYEVNVNINPVIFLVPNKIIYDTLLLKINSFAWNGCLIHFEKGNFNLEWIKDWFVDAINILERNLKTKNIGVLHSLKFFKEDNCLEVDFGTLSVSKILSFFDLLSKNGIKQLEINSSYK